MGESTRKEVLLTASNSDAIYMYIVYYLSFQIDVSNKTISLSLQGLSYYHNYYQQILLFSITFSFLGWIWWLLTTVVEQYMSCQRLETSPQMRSDQAELINRFNNRVHMAFILMLAAIVYLVYGTYADYLVYCYNS